MKLIKLIILVVLFASCKSSHLGQDLAQISDKKIFVLKNCPKNASCSLELIPRSGIQLKKDEFNYSFIEIKEASSTLLKYQFKRDELPNTADGHYSELVYIEIPKNIERLQLENKQLSSTMIFGRQCFCKGTDGYHKVLKGRLEVYISKNILTLKTNFSVDNIPQIITEINESIVLYQ